MEDLAFWFLVSFGKICTPILLNGVLKFAYMFITYLEQLCTFQYKFYTNLLLVLLSLKKHQKMDGFQTS